MILIKLLHLMGSICFLLGSALPVPPSTSAFYVAGSIMFIIASLMALGEDVG